MRIYVSLPDLADGRQTIRSSKLHSSLHDPAVDMTADDRPWRNQDSWWRLDCSRLDEGRLAAAGRGVTL